MATFPTFQFTKDFVKVRFFAPATPMALGQRWLGMPRGVYLGFLPSVTPGSLNLSLNVEPNNGFSLLKVGSSNQHAQVDIFTATSVVMNFTGHSQYPVYVIARAEVPIIGATKAKIFTRTTPATGPEEILICKVDMSGSDLIVDVTEPENRHAPTAFQTQAFGYMPTNSVTNLAEASESVSEVIDARTSTYTGAHTDLSTRVNTDLSGEEMANRLGLRCNQVIGNSYSVAALASTVNVSGSMTSTGREFAPAMTIEAGGSGSIEGAITSSPRNMCFVINEATGERIVDATTEDPVFGRLDFSFGTVGFGRQIIFTNASTSITGVGSPFQAPLAEGDIVLGPDGNYYEISEFIGLNEAVLGAAFQGISGSVTNTSYRRFTLVLLTVSGGTFTLPTATEMRFLFPAFFRTDRAIFDGTLFLKKNGERPPVELATESVLGKALIASSGGLVGSFRTIKDSGSSIGNDFHTLNFQSGGAADAGGGVATVSVAGLQGPPGPSADVGPDGPSGGAGPGYSTNNTFESSTFSTTPTPSAISHTVDFAFTAPSLTNISHLFGGFSGFDWGAVGQTVEITSITTPGATIGQIVGSLGPGATNARFKLFLGAMQ